MAFSTDEDLQKLIPDILSLGIFSFADEHAKAKSDIEREIRNRWWEKRGLSGELKPQYLTDSQWNMTAVYLVLWKYALPQLTNWVDGDRFQNMITFYKSRYGEEIEDVFQDGVEYDDDNNGTVDEDEKFPINHGRLVR
tara:strand:- start:299 stop:712 length:414 start_codon:yes stop_codon:yes gene_type:complete